MTTATEDFVLSVATPGSISSVTVFSKFQEAGLYQAIHVAMVDLDDIEELFDGDAAAQSLGRDAWKAAKPLVEGWTKVPSVSRPPSAVPKAVPHPKVPGVLAAWSATHSAKAVSMAFSSFPQRVVFGRGVKRPA